MAQSGSKAFERIDLLQKMQIPNGCSQRKCQGKEIFVLHVSTDDDIEEQILQEVQSVFRDEALLETIWESAQKKLVASAPSIDTELKELHSQRVKRQAALDRYFLAFESGTMAPPDCHQRIEDLSTQIRQLDEERQTLKEKRTTLDLPAIKTDFLHEILSNLRSVVEAVPPQQKKHLLHLLVKKVLIKYQHTFEAWYRLPHFHGVRTLGNMIASTSQYAHQTDSIRFRLSTQAVFQIPPNQDKATAGLNCRKLQVAIYAVRR